jgi:hypothetical protein
MVLSQDDFDQNLAIFGDLSFSYYTKRRLIVVRGQ